MLNKEDKDGIIEFLKGRILEIRNAVTGICTNKSVYVYDYDDDDYYEVENECNMKHQLGEDDKDRVLDLCEKTLAEVTF